MENNEVYVLTGKDPFYHELMVLGIYHDIPTLRLAWEEEFEPVGYTDKNLSSFEVV